MSIPDIDAMLKEATERNASDLHLKAGLPPILRIHGDLSPMTNFEPNSPDSMVKVALKIMSERQQNEFKKKHQVDMAYSLPGVGRFRVNIFMQRGAVGIVFRVIPAHIKSFEALHLPPVLEKLSQTMRGLVLVTGVTGSGKSTTLAGIVDYINNHRSSHIITIEDPIEFTHKDHKSIINQREIGVDAPSFAEAMRAALRQDPDVILVGEMRDLETIDIALTAAETGHLVLSTLHTIDAVETVNRIISVFPPYQQKQIRIQLAGIVQGIISQRLLPTVDHDRIPAVEILVSNSRVKACIEDKEKTKDLSDAIIKGRSTTGMQTFDQSIESHLAEGLISYEVALRYASNPDDFALKMSGGISTTSDHVAEEMAEADAAEAAEDDEFAGFDEFGNDDGDDIERF